MTKPNKILFIIIVVSLAIISLICVVFYNQIRSAIRNVPNAVESVIFGSNKAQEEVIDFQNTNSQMQKSYPISTKREDFLRYTDEAYSNFRALNSLGLKNNIIFRSSSPIDNSINRASQAGKAIQDHNIHYIVNLEDTKEEAEIKIAASNDLLKETIDYYQNQKILYAPLNDNLTDVSNKEKIKEIFEFIASANEPVLIHCNDGLDNTGLICFLISALTCSTYDYLKADYFQSYYSLCNLPENQSTKAFRDAIDFKFRYVIGIPLKISNQTVMSANLNLYAKAYLSECKLSEDTINEVYTKVIET